MQRTVTSTWITSGVAVVGAGVIAAAPVAAPPPGLTGPPAQAVQLTAAGLDLSGWTDLFTNTEDNVKGLFEHSAVPFPILQQLLVNQVEHLKDLFTTGGFNTVLADIEHNVTAGLGAPFTPFEPTFSPLPDYIYPSLDPTEGTVHIAGESHTFLGTLTYGPFDFPFFSHAGLFDLLSGSSGLLNDLSPGLGSTASELLNLAGSPLSGVLWGALGVVASPLVQLYDDYEQLVTAFSASSPNLEGIFDDLLNDPANILNAFLNGTTLPVNLLSNSGFDALVGPLLEPYLGQTITDALLKALDVNVNTPIALGGLLSPGGSLFDALGIDATLGANFTLPLVGPTTFTGAVELAGDHVGPIGSMIELGQAIANAIGWDDLGNQPIDALGSIF